MTDKTDKLPPLPPGFTLDKPVGPGANLPPLPPGFTLDKPPARSPYKKTYPEVLAEARKMIASDPSYGPSSALIQGVLPVMPDIESSLYATNQYWNNAIDALQGKSPDRNPDDVKRALLKASQEAVDKYGRDHPITNFALQIPGQILLWEKTAALAPLKALPALHRAAVVGGLMGGYYAAGESRGNLKQRAKAAALGGALGAPLGMVGEVLSPLIPKAVGATTRAARDSLAQLNRWLESHGMTEKQIEEFARTKGVPAAQAAVRALIKKYDPTGTLLRETRPTGPGETTAERLGPEAVERARDLIAKDLPISRDVSVKIKTRLADAAARTEGMIADAAGVDRDAIEGNFARETAKFEAQAKPAFDKFYQFGDKISSPALDEVSQTPAYSRAMREAAEIAENNFENPYQLGLRLEAGDPREIVASRLSNLSGLSDDLLNSNFRKMVADLRARVQPLYDKFYEHTGLASDVIRSLSQNPFVLDAVPLAAKIARSQGHNPFEEGLVTEEERAALEKAGKEPPKILSARAWDYVKQGLDDMLDTYREKTPPYRLNLDNRGREILRQRTALMEELRNPTQPWGANGAAAFDAGGDPIRMEEAFGKASDVMSRKTNDENFTNYWAKLAPQDREALKTGIVSMYQDAARSGRGRLEDLLTPLSRDKLRTIFGDDVADKLTATVEQLTTQVLPDVKPTAKTWEYIRRALDKQMAAVKSRSRTGIIEPNDDANLSVNGVLNSLTAALKDPNQPWGRIYETALDLFGEARSRTDAYKKAASLFSDNVSAENFEAQFTQMSEPEKQAFRAGLARDVRDAMRNAAEGAIPPSTFFDRYLTKTFKDKLRLAFGDKAPRMIQQLEAEDSLLKSGRRLISKRTQVEEAEPSNRNIPGAVIHSGLAATAAASHHPGWALYNAGKIFRELSRGTIGATPEGRELNNEMLRLIALSPQELTRELASFAPEKRKEINEVLAWIRSNPAIQRTMRSIARPFVPSMLARLGGQTAAAMLAPSESESDLSSRLAPTPAAPSPRPAVGATPAPVAPAAPTTTTSATDLTPQKILSMAYDASVNAGIDPGLYQRVIQHGEQSLSDPNAVSRKGARGPAQLTAATANEVGVQDINDPQQNIAGGARYLAKMLQRYNGDVMRAVAAYNAGPEAVDSGNWVTYPETVKYVHRVLGIAVSPTPTTSAPPSPALQLPADAFRMSY